MVCPSVLRKLRIKAIGCGQRGIANTLDLVIRHRLQGLLLSRLQQIGAQLYLVYLLYRLLCVLDDAKVPVFVHERLPVVESRLEISFLRCLVLYV